MPGIKHSWVYFPERKGLVSGLILSFYSIGSILSILLAQVVANPENEAPTDEGDGGERYYKSESGVVARVPAMIRALALMYSVMIVIACGLITKKDETV